VLLPALPPLLLAELNIQSNGRSAFKLPAIPIPAPGTTPTPLLLLLLVSGTACATLASGVQLSQAAPAGARMRRQGTRCAQSNGDAGFRASMSSKDGLWINTFYPSHCQLLAVRHATCSGYDRRQVDINWTSMGLKPVVFWH
jgi:hypothetical protein